MSTRCKRRDAGQVLVFFALVLALVLLSLICLVGDAAFLFGWSDRLQAAAQLAAQSGADSVDPRYLYGGGCSTQQRCDAYIVDVSDADRKGSLFAFQRACIEAGDQSAQVPGRDGSVKSPDAPQAPDGTACDSDGCHVFATVTRVLQLPVGFPGFPSTLTLHASAYAAPVVGEQQARLVCTGGPWVPASP